MGAVFFLLLLLIEFCISLFFVAVSILILFILWNKKKKGNKIKKSWMIPLYIVLVFSVIGILLPVSFILFLRICNEEAYKKPIYAKSGEIYYWNVENESFQMKKEDYVMIDYYYEYSEEDSFIHFNGESIEKLRKSPSANIKYKESFDPIGDFLGKLLAGKSYKEMDISTIYPIENQGKFEMYEINSSLYCKKSQKNDILDYYEKTDRYDFDNCSVTYEVFPESEAKNTRYKEIQKQVKFEKGIIDKFKKLYSTKKGLQKINVPKKYLDIINAEKEGTPFSGFDTRYLIIDSKDNLAYIHMYFAHLNGKYYLIIEDEYESDQSDTYRLIRETLTVYPIDKETSEYLEHEIF